MELGSEYAIRPSDDVFVLENAWLWIYVFSLFWLISLQSGVFASDLYKLLDVCDITSLPYLLVWHPVLLMSVWNSAPYVMTGCLIHLLMNEILFSTGFCILTKEVSRFGRICLFFWLYNQSGGRLQKSLGPVHINLRGHLCFHTDPPPQHPHNTPSSQSRLNITQIEGG